MSADVRHLARLPDWPERLALTIERARGVPFAWGQADCVSFAAASVHAVTGADVLGPWRGGWNSAGDAYRLLRRRGGLLATVCSVIGSALPDINLARRGDLLLIGAQHPWLAVCDGARWWAPSRMGLASGVTAHANWFWPVGWAEHA